MSGRNCVSQRSASSSVASESLRYDYAILPNNTAESIIFFDETNDPIFGANSVRMLSIVAIQELSWRNNLATNVVLYQGLASGALFAMSSSPGKRYLTRTCDS